MDIAVGNDGNDIGRCWLLIEIEDYNMWIYSDIRLYHSVGNEANVERKPLEFFGRGLHLETGIYFNWCLVGNPIS